MGIGVECIFSGDGRLTIKRIDDNGRWLPVEQGRQWHDGDGRHVLVMLHNRVHTLTLHPETLTWTIAPSTDRIAV